MSIDLGMAIEDSRDVAVVQRSSYMSDMKSRFRSTVGARLCKSAFLKILPILNIL